MRKTPYLICLLMLLTSLSGCIGGEDVETSEGDDVELGESTDDWPTYYVPTANDLPTCDANTLGRLYYVEADTNFQACMSTGWQVVQIGGASANVLVNQPPRITAQIMPLDDDMHNLTPNGWYYNATAHWSATDPEGEQVTVGIDADRDGVIDLNLDGAEGFSLIELDWNGSVHYDRLEIEGERFLHMYRLFDVIAEDASGTTSTLTVISPAMSHLHMRDIYDADDANDISVIFPDTLQADIDWLGTPSSPLTPPSFDANDHATDATAGTDDALIVLQLQGDYNLNWAILDVQLIDSSGNSTSCTTEATAECSLVQHGSDDTMWESGELVHVTEGGTDMCSDTCTFEIIITDTNTGDQIAGTGLVMVE